MTIMDASYVIEVVNDLVWKTLRFPAADARSYPALG